MSLTLTHTVDNYEVAVAIGDKDLSLLAIAGQLEEYSARLTRDQHLTHEIVEAEDGPSDPVKAVLFLKRFADSVIAKLRDDPDYADQLPPEK